ncbi:MAG: DNA topoisomerase (ATP-hydrolyzing) subunit A [Mycoplasmoidaceae bacterium]
MMKYKDKIDTEKIKSDLLKTKINNQSISVEIEKSFLEYAMSVITSRALPDVRDGLKPVHRRILYAAYNLGMTSDKPYKKSARLVGEIIGKYHPHGDSAVYESSVRMAQSFSLRYPLLDGHGNFGSIDGDRAAAMRYTEIRLSKISSELLKNIDKDTVNFTENYDGSEIEPSILPASFPNLLVNGSSGIAVGMSTNILPHNLSEIIDGAIFLANNPDVNVTDLLEYIKGPDLPTKAEIIGNKGIIDYFTTGKGTVIVRSKYHIEEIENGKNNIIITEIPYMVNKINLIEQIVKLVKNDQIKGINDLRDETSRKGIRIVIEIKKDVIPGIILNKLFKSTDLQTRISVNMICLKDGIPSRLNMKDCLFAYIQHQIDILTRKTKFELKKATDRHHILEGLFIAINDIDYIIDAIKNSFNNEELEFKLKNKYSFSGIQIKSILDMKLRNLSSLEKKKISDELLEIKNRIKYFNFLLSSEDEKIKIICNDMLEIKDKYGDERITNILYGISDVINDEDLIPIEDVVITMSENGYLKRIPVETYKLQNRGGVGIKAITTHNDDYVKLLIITSTHTDLLIFSDKGKVYKIRAHKIPVGSRSAKGIPALNLINIEKSEKIMNILSVDDYKNGYLLFCTSRGLVKKTKISNFSSIQRNGKIAIVLKSNDYLFSVQKSLDGSEIYIASSSGRLVRFNDNNIRYSGRKSSGVIGMKVAKIHRIVGCSTSLNGSLMLSIGENGIGKISSIDKYRMTKRGARGVITLKLNDKTGNMAFSTAINGDEELLMLNSEGKIIRLYLKDIRVIGRITSGVKLVNISEGNRILSAAIFQNQDSVNDDSEDFFEPNIKEN